jgi:hypothetical protein
MMTQALRDSDKAARLLAVDRLPAFWRRLAADSRRNFDAPPEV